MNANLTIAFVERQKPREKRYDVRDKIINELILRVETSGKKTYLLDCKKTNGKRTSLKIGDAAIMSPSQAREIAKEKLFLISQGLELREKDKLTLKKLIDTYYKNWTADNHKDGNLAIKMLKNNFNEFMDTELIQITTNSGAQQKSRAASKPLPQTDTYPRCGGPFTGHIRTTSSPNILLRRSKKPERPTARQKYATYPKTNAKDSLRP